MARYYPVSPLFWADQDAQRWSDREKLLALYLLTCEHRNLEGLYRLPLAYVEEDLGWTREQVAEAMETLRAAGFVKYDEAARVVFVCKALKYQAPKSPNQIKGAISSLQEVPTTQLLSDLVAASERYAPEFHAALREIMPDTHSHASRNGLEVVAGGVS